AFLLHRLDRAAGAFGLVEDLGKFLEACQQGRSRDVPKSPRSERQGSQFIGSPFASVLASRVCSGNVDSGNDLLLEMAWVGAIVVRADRRRVVGLARGDVAEVVADEALEPVHSRRLHRVELRVPRVEAEPDVVAERVQLWVVFLKACVDAVVARAGRVVRVEAEPGGGGLGTGRAGQPAVVEGDEHGAVRGRRQGLLEGLY